MRPASPIIAGGRVASLTVLTVSSFAAARGPMMLSVLCTSASAENAMCSSDNWPDSSLEKSRMSLRISSRLSPALWIASTKRRCSLSRLVSSNVVDNPSTAFIGVRIS